jgi:hypothetical protein
MLVKDSAGQLVGSYLSLYNALSTQPADAVFIRAFSTSFAIPFTTSQLGGGQVLEDSFAALYYASSDCSGTAYFSKPNPQDGNPFSVVPQAGVGGTIAYVMGQPPSGMTLNYYVALTPGSANGPCTTGALTAFFNPVIASYDLSTLNLVPPFSVQ